MTVYNVLSEFGGRTLPQTEDDLSMAPYWVIAVWPWARRITFDRSQLASASVNISRNQDLSDAGKTLPVIVMFEDCTSLNISGNKSSYVHQLNARFMESGKRYMNRIASGDWCAAWIVYGREKFKDLVKRIKGGQPCNNFDDGLKFVGKLLSFREDGNIDAAGHKTVFLDFSALAFQEFGNETYFDPVLKQNLPFFSQISGDLGVATQILQNLSNKGGLDSNTFIPIALKIMLGEGGSSSFAQPHQLFDTQAAATSGGVTSVTPPPVAYVVPNDVARMLGQAVAGSQTGLFSYCDVLEAIIGVQKYGTGPDAGTQPATNSNMLDIGIDSASATTQANPVADVFMPKGSKKLSTRMHLLGKESPDLDLLGLFAFVPTPFFGKPLWNLLDQYINKAVNEMYTTLRVNYAGNIVPTLVARQKPYSTGLYQRQGVTLTEFLELPRWTIAPILGKNWNLGRGDQLHVNLGHVSAVPVLNTPASQIAAQHARNPPIVDLEDLQRHGLRPYQDQVLASVTDCSGTEPHKWTEMVMDWHMGEHLFYNGTLGTQGISAPVCIGDNLEWDLVVYQIEAVGHACSMSGDGRVRDFRTNFQLSHGFRSDNDTKKVHPTTNEGPPGNTQPATNSDLIDVDVDASVDNTVASPEVQIYPGIDETDNVALWPGITGDFED